MGGWLKRRRLRPELMDDPDIDPDSHRNALRGLARLNRLGRASGQLWPLLGRELQAAGGRPLRLLDVACGRGDVLKALASRSKGRIRGLGLDVSPQAVREASQDTPPCVAFRVGDVLDSQQPLPTADVVLCSLFLHHLRDGDVAILLARMGSAARRLVIASDLERSVSNWLLIWAGARLVTRSPVVHVDSARSVEASWKQGELERLCHKAGLRQVRVRRAFPARLILTARPYSGSGRNT